MSFDSVPEFFAMGGHGLYVWLCYATSLVVVLVNVLAVRHQRRAAMRELADQQVRAGAGGAS
ncbi:MAG: heme exporter protein CcmD [Gammaproteobacteria bacterium]|nr:heme exporter protein CcmD [Gammaproteobacteria bacterium]